VIERLLAADAALDREDLDVAEKLFGQVAEADPRNAIAAVGLGRVAAGRDDAAGARTWFRRALEIDPDEAAARRLLAALDREVPEAISVQVAAEIEPAAQVEAPLQVSTARSAASPESRAITTLAPARQSLLGRILGWLGLRRPAQRR
jgi:tetratricopeptide (TPR) repeat protein